MPKYQRVIASRTITAFLFPSIAALFTVWVNAQDLILKIDSRIASGDLNALYAIVHSKINSGKQEGSFFGQPYGQDFDSIPSMDALYIGLLKVLNVIADNSIVSVNILIILLFVLNSLLLSWLFRLLKFPHVVSFFALLIVISLPWQTGRIAHISLIPFMVCFLGIISILVPNTVSNYKSKVLALGIFLGLFFTYFTLYGLIMFFIYALAQKERVKLSYLFVFPFGAGLGFLFNYAVSTDFFSKTSSATNRGVWESHIYGGVPFLPWIPLPWNSVLSKTRYQELLSEFPAANESEAWSNYGGLGISILLCIFLGLRIYFLFTKSSSEWYSSTQVKQFILTFLVMYAFFIRDGLGIAFSALISPQFRAWNRITPVLQVLIVVLAFKTLLLLKENFSKQTNLKLNTVMCVLLTFLVWTQFSDTSKISPKVNDVQEIELKSFAMEVKRADLKNSCSIFQYPVLGFPEIPPYGKILDYDSFLVPMYVDKYTWSYGTLKTNPEFEKFRLSFDLSDANSQSQLKQMGFCGLLLDNYGSSVDRAFLDQIVDWDIYQTIQSSSGRWTFLSFTS